VPVGGALAPVLECAGVTALAARRPGPDAPRQPKAVLRFACRRSPKQPRSISWLASTPHTGPLLVRGGEGDDPWAICAPLWPSASASIRVHPRFLSWGSCVSRLPRAWRLHQSQAVGVKLLLAGARPGWYGFDVPRKIRQLVAELEQAGFVVVPGGSTLRLMADADFRFQTPRRR